MPRARKIGKKAFGEAFAAHYGYVAPTARMLGITEQTVRNYLRSWPEYLEVLETRGVDLVSRAAGVQVDLLDGTAEQRAAASRFILTHHKMAPAVGYGATRQLSIGGQIEHRVIVAPPVLPLAEVETTGRPLAPVLQLAAGNGQHSNGQASNGQAGNGQAGNGQAGNGQHGNGQHGNGQASNGQHE